MAADVWTSRIPEGVAYPIELTEFVTTIEGKNGPFDKWKASRPRSNPEHSSEKYELEHIWLLVVGDTLRQELKDAHLRKESKVTLWREGRKARMEVGWASPATRPSSTPAPGPAAAAPPAPTLPARGLPPGVQAKDYLDGMILATSYSVRFLRDRGHGPPEGLQRESPSAHAIWERTLLEVGAEIGREAAIAAAAAGRDLVGELRRLSRDEELQRGS